MTEKELWNWYKKYWEKKFPDFTKSEFILNKEGNIFGLKVKRPDWKNPTIKYLKDAQFAYSKEHKENKQDRLFNVSLTKQEPKQPKKFKTIGCCLDEYKYNQVKKLAESYGMSVHELLKNLINQVLKENK